MYNTSDIGIAALLLTKGFSFEGAKKKDERISDFYFEGDDEQMREEVGKWWNGKQLIEPTGFLKNMRSLRALVINNRSR